MYHSTMKQPRLARRIFKGFAVLAMLGVLGIAALLGSLWLERRTEITLPTPTGPFAVGRAIYDWTDDTKLDTLAPVPGTKRELLVWMWYPSPADHARRGIRRSVELLDAGRGSGQSRLRRRRLRCALPHFQRCFS